MEQSAAAGHIPSPGIGSRQMLLNKSFKLAIRSLLTTCSKQDFFNAFSTFDKLQQEALYQTFIEVITSVHQDIEVATKLDTVEQLVEEQALDILSNEMTSLVDVRQGVSKAKKDEITYLTSKLELAVEQNRHMKARIDTLKKERLHSLGTADAAGKLRTWSSNYGQLAQQ